MMLGAGKQVMVLSAGALLPRMHLVDLAREKGGQIIVPTGALLGLDAVSAAAEGKIASVRMITRKPPRGLVGAPHLVENDISVEGLVRAAFSSSVEALATRRRAFRPMSMWRLRSRWPGSGPDATTIEIWAGPPQ